MAERGKFTEFEWEIMQILWDRGIASVREVEEEYCKKVKKKAYTTIQTYMERLTTKGILEKCKIGMVNFYRPNVEKESVLKNETKRFVNIAFRGSFSKLASYLIHSEGIKQEDLEEIKKMIEAKEKDND